MAKLKLVRLSTKNAKVEMAGGIKEADGKSYASVTSGGIPFVVLEFEDDTNLFKYSRAVRLIYANNGKWPGASAEQLKNYEGKEVPGEFVTKSVNPYEIVGNDGVARKVSTYTTFVMSHENWITVFTNAGYDIVDETGAIIHEAKPQRTAPSQKESAGVKQD